MGVHVSWDEHNDSLIWLVFAGRWSWQDYCSAHREAVRLIESVDHYVDIIADMFQAASAPMDSDDQSIRRVLEEAPRNHGLTVLVGADRFTRMIISIQQKYIPVVQTRLVMVDTFDEAYNIIVGRREAIQNKRPPAAAK